MADMNDKIETVAVRLPKSTLDGLDEMARQREQASPWLNVTRADLLREGVYRIMSNEFLSIIQPSTPLLAVLGNGTKHPVLALGFRSDGRIVPFILYELRGLSDIYSAEVVSKYLGTGQWAIYPGK